MMLGGVFRPGMRGYFVPLAAGLALAVSAFLPWVVVGDLSLNGVPDVAALWVVGLGLLATTLSALSLITRKNSRHPLLVVGLAALGIVFLSGRILPQAARERATLRSQAIAIVDNAPMAAEPTAMAGSGIYLGVIAASVLVLFGLTIVVKRAGQPYAVAEPDDDV